MALKVNSYVKNDQISYGMPIKLVISVDKPRVSPDIQSLKQKFKIISQSSSRRIQIINGQKKQNIKKIYALKPKNLKKNPEKPTSITIPAIKVGQQKTSSHQVTITPIQNQVQNNNQTIFKIQSKIDEKSVYIQQQVLMTIQVFIAESKLNAVRSVRLTPLGLSDALTEKLGPPTKSTKQINGQKYIVTQLQYAIFPQKSGKITIPSLIFQAQLIDSSGQRNQQSHFGLKTPSFNSIKTIRLATQSHIIHSKPIPANYPGQWLPTSQLKLNQNIKTPNKIHTGDVIKRRITIQADKLLGQQMPKLPMPKVKNMSTYRDKTNFKTLQKANHIQGRRTETFNYMANKPGKVTLPQIKVHWWDTKTNTIKTRTLKEKHLQVMPAKNNDQSSLQANQNAPKSSSNSIDQHKINSTNEKPSNPQIDSATKNHYRFYGALLLGIAAILILISGFIVFIRKIQKSKLTFKNSQTQNSSVSQNGQPPDFSDHAESYSNQKGKIAKQEPKTSDYWYQRLKQTYETGDYHRIRQQWCSIAYHTRRQNMNDIYALMEQAPPRLRNHLIQIDRLLYGQAMNQPEHFSAVKSDIEAFLNYLFSSCNKQAKSTLPRFYPDV